MALTRPDLFRTLIDGTRLAAAELAERADRALRPDYWRRLCPGLRVGGGGRRVAGTIRDVDRVDLGRRLREEGWAVTAPLLSKRTVGRMRNAIVAVKDAGWPPVFAFVYDEFWSVWKLPSITALVGDALGSPVHMRARVWAYYVHPARGAKGWPPHAEAYGTRGLSVWMPLTDATLDNGCIYVVPKDLIARRVDIGGVFRAERVGLDTLSALLQAARALPAAAGSILLWDFDVIHWGSTVHRPGEPRISISAEFLPPGAGGTDLTLVRRVEGLPSFHERLRLIAENIGFFAKNDAWTAKYEDLGPALIGALSRR